MQPLTREQRAELARDLEAALAALEEEMAALESLTAPVAPDRAIGRLSRLEAINEKSVNEAALRSAQVRARRIRAALARIDEEDFGDCSGCGEPIPIARLRSVPGTRLCVPCAEKAGG